MNGFYGEWNPLCTWCGGYMHTGHTADCPVTRERDKRMEKLVALLTPKPENSQEGPDK